MLFKSSRFLGMYHIVGGHSISRNETDLGWLIKFCDLKKTSCEYILMRTNSLLRRNRLYSFSFSVAGKKVKMYQSDSNWNTHTIWWYPTGHSLKAVMMFGSIQGTRIVTAWGLNTYLVSGFLDVLLLFSLSYSASR